jgi:hypothetical protein
MCAKPEKKKAHRQFRESVRLRQPVTLTGKGSYAVKSLRMELGWVGKNWARERSMDYSVVNRSTTDSAKQDLNDVTVRTMGPVY